jgi:hypothetical protein
MTSIIEQYGKRRHRPQELDRQEPIMPPGPRTNIPTAPHEKTAQALVFVTQLNEEVAALREENARLRADLNLSMLRCRDLERDRNSMFTDMEAYRRYSVTVQTHLRTIVDCCKRANDEAIEAGEKVTMPAGDVEQTTKLLDDTERDLREIAAAEVMGGKFGANGRPEEGDKSA